MKSISLLIGFLLMSVAAFSQPANDDPCGAISIPVSPPDFTGIGCSPSTNYSWASATLTAATPNPSCLASGFSNIRDVWYKLVVPASGSIRFNLKAGLPIVYTFYRPATCTSTITFIEITCKTVLAADVNKDTATILNGLTSGTTIYLRMMRSTEMPNVSGSVLMCAAENIPTPVIDNSKRIGIGTNSPLAKLDVVGTMIVRDSLQVGKSIETKEKIKAAGMQITTGAGANKMMVSDANGVGSWIDRDYLFSSAWITSPYNSRDTVVDGTCMRLRHLDAPELTSTVLNTKLITVYFRVGSIGPYQLPYISDAGGAINQINCIFQQGKILVYRHTYNTCRFNSGIAESYPGQPVLVNLPQSLEYRYVIHN
jgi:hypothetical protein